MIIANFIKKLARAILPFCAYSFSKKVFTAISHKYLSYSCRKSAEKYLLKHKTSKLQLGCAATLMEDWFNTDCRLLIKGVSFLDVTKRFPLPNNSFDYIFSEHLIEHLEYGGAAFMLGECFRVLKDKGKIRIATPDVDLCLEFYRGDNLSKLQEEYIHWVLDKSWPDKLSKKNIFILNKLFYGWEHQFIYNFESLQLLLQKTGFSNISNCNIGKSTDSNLHNMERILSKVNPRYKALGSLAIEAQKVVRSQ